MYLLIESANVYILEEILLCMYEAEKTLKIRNASKSVFIEARRLFKETILLDFLNSSRHEDVIEMIEYSNEPNRIIELTKVNILSRVKRFRSRKLVRGSFHADRLVFIWRQLE